MRMINYEVKNCIGESDYITTLISAFNELADKAKEEIDKKYMNILESVKAFLILIYICKRLINRLNLFLSVVLLPLTLKTLRHSAAFFRRAGIVA
jgi:hypothetical protein